jgi:hypothetical protein
MKFRKPPYEWNVQKHWDSKHPYRFRTWLRGRLPWVLINIGFAKKGKDCEIVGGWHRWYNSDNIISKCYHCNVEAKGKLW